VMLVKLCSFFKVQKITNNHNANNIFLGNLMNKIVLIFLAMFLPPVAVFLNQVLVKT
jgi:hypothetical protein